MSKTKATIALACAAALAAGPALAVYPERAITFILPFPPGGGTGVGVQTWLPYMEKCLGAGATIAMIPKPGAGGVLAFTEIAQASPDGYTIGGLNMPNLVAQDISTDTQYTIDDYTYLGALVGVNASVLVRNDSPMKTLADLVEQAKTSSQPINIAVGALGGDDHLSAVRFMNQAGVTFTFVPFNSSAAARNALIGGHVDVASFSDADTAQFTDSIRPLGVAASSRSKLFPDTPTFREQGYDIVAGSNHLVAGPAGMPEEAVTKIRDCFAQIAADPDFLADAEKRAVPISPIAGADIAAFVKEQYGIFEVLLKENPPPQ